MTWIRAMSKAMSVMREVKRLQKRRMPAFEIRWYIAKQLFLFSKKKA
jgi:hypothetical protein